MPTFTVGKQRVLFTVESYQAGTSHTSYDLTPDDQLFLMIRRNIQTEGELILVQNFFEELKEKVK
jgi:hypothetical protein